METYEIVQAAERTDVSVEELRRLVELGIINPDARDRFTAGDLRHVSMVNSLVAAGVPLDSLAGAVRSGQVSLAFLNEPAFERFSALSGVTFGQLAEQRSLMRSTEPFPARLWRQLTR